MITKPNPQIRCCLLYFAANFQRKVDRIPMGMFRKRCPFFFGSFSLVNPHGYTKGNVISLGVATKIVVTYCSGFLQVLIKG